jgi:hypothetical protein
MISVRIRWGEAESSLSTTAAVLPFGPGHDRDPQLAADVPRPSVEDVLLQPREERHLGDFVAG